eukprot:Skav217222  [mRNA]  locus=scaffold143:352589:365658:- [translate_table: standard]
MPCPLDICDLNVVKPSQLGSRSRSSPRWYLAGLSREPVVAGPRVSQQRGLRVGPALLMRYHLGPFLLLFPTANCIRDILDADRDPHALQADASRQALLQRSAKVAEESQLRHSIEDDDEEDQAEEEKATEESAPSEGNSSHEEPDGAEQVEDNIRDRDVYAKTAADQKEITSAIDAFGSATKKAEQKAKNVDDKLAKYNGRVVELGQQLDKLSRAARRYHMQTMRWFKDLEQDNAKSLEPALLPLQAPVLSSLAPSQTGRATLGRRRAGASQSAKGSMLSIGSIRKDSLQRLLEDCDFWGLKLLQREQKGGLTRRFLTRRKELRQRRERCTLLARGGEGLRVNARFVRSSSLEWPCCEVCIGCIGAPLWQGGGALLLCCTIHQSRLQATPSTDGQIRADIYVEPSAQPQAPRISQVHTPEGEIEIFQLCAGAMLRVRENRALRLRLCRGRCAGTLHQLVKPLGGKGLQRRATTELMRMGAAGSVLLISASWYKAGPSREETTGLPEISLAEFQKHVTESSLWVAYGGVVYDVTSFAAEHPGRSRVMDALAPYAIGTLMLSSTQSDAHEFLLVVDAKLSSRLEPCASHWSPGVSERGTCEASGWPRAVDAPG